MGAGSSQINWIYMAAMKISLIQSGDHAALFKAFMVPSGFSSSAKLLTYHFSLFLAGSSNLASSRCNMIRPAFSRARFCKAHWVEEAGKKRESVRCHLLGFLFHHLFLPFSSNNHSSVNEKNADSPFVSLVAQGYGFVIQLQPVFLPH